MKVISHIGVVHKTWLSGTNTYYLACNPASLVSVGSKWFGSWKPSDAEVTCSKCIAIKVNDLHKPQNADNIEWAIKRTYGTTLIPVKSKQIGEKILLGHQKGWGILVFRYVSEWMEDVEH